MSHVRDAAYTIGLSALAGFGCSRNMNAASVRKRPSTDLSIPFGYRISNAGWKSPRDPLARTAWPATAEELAGVGLAESSSQPARTDSLNPGVGYLEKRR